MNIGCRMLFSGVLIGFVGCSAQKVFYLDNVDKDAKAALETAVRHAGFKVADVQVTKLKLDREWASPVYEVEFKKGWHEYEIDVDAKTGRVLKMEKEFDW